MSDPTREALEHIIRLAEVIPYSADVEQAGMQAGVVIETARAALSTTPAREDTAWAAAEAALPEGWRIEGVMLVDTSDDEDLNVELVEWEAEASSDRGQRSVTALGPTPAAALLALAEKLREYQP